MAIFYDDIPHLATAAEKSWKKAIIAFTGFCTVLIGSSNSAVIATPVLIVQQASSRAPQTITGRLDQNSDVLEDRWHATIETHTFEGNAGEALTIELTSDDFDALPGFTKSDWGRYCRTDDDGEGGTNARIVITLPITGTYTMVATSYQARESWGLPTGVARSNPRRTRACH